MVKRILIILSCLYLLTFSVNSFSQKRALQRLAEIFDNGPQKDISLSDQVNEIWFIFFTQEKMNWKDFYYQKEMVVTTLNIEEKYGKLSLNPAFIHSFSALRFLIDELAINRCKEDEAIHYCYVITSSKVADSSDDPLMFYFAKKAVEVWKQMRSKGKSPKADTIQKLLLTLEYAPYEDAHKDAWEIFVNISPKEGAYFYDFIDSLAVIYWRLSKTFSNEQVDYIFNLFEKVDKKRIYEPDFVLLVSKDKEYTKSVIEKKKFSLHFKEIREIQDYMVEYMKINIFERGDF